MKKLSKLQINPEKFLNPEKFINTEELKELKGGYDGYWCCICYQGIEAKGYMAGAGSSEECHLLCAEAGYNDAQYTTNGGGNC